MMTTKLMVIALLTAPALLPLWPFIGDKQYRFCNSTIPICAEIGWTFRTPPDGQTQLPVLEQEQREGGAPPRWKLAYVEYKDNAEPWDTIQEEVAKRLIEQSRDPEHYGRPYGRPIHLIVYVHGWANNANEAQANKMRDVEKFRAYLDQYVERLSDTDRPPVVGIYFAWHGRSLDLPAPLHIPSFWTRSAAARKVGQGQLYRDVQCVVEMAKRQGHAGGQYSRPGICTTPGQRIAGLMGPRRQVEEEDQASLSLHAQQRSRVILMGHSFGARVLETTLIGGEPSRGPVAGICKGLVHSQSQRPYVDLILFENAATGARFVRRQFVNCQPCGRGRTGCDDDRKKPLNFANTIMVRPYSFDKQHCEQPGNGTKPECQPYPLIVSISGKWDLATRVLLTLASGQIPAPFLPWLQSHRVDEVPSSHQVHPENGDVLTFELESGGQKHTYLVRRKPGRRITPVNAIWTMAVPRAVVSSHGDVWNPGYVNLQLGIITSHDQSAETLQKNLKTMN